MTKVQSEYFDAGIEKNFKASRLELQAFFNQ